MINALGVCALEIGSLEECSFEISALELGALGAGVLAEYAFGVGALGVCALAKYAFGACTFEVCALLSGPIDFSIPFSMFSIVEFYLRISDRKFLPPFQLIYQLY